MDSCRNNISIPQDMAVQHMNNGSCAAVLLSLYYMTFGKMITYNHLRSIAAFSIQSKTYCSSLRSFFSLSLYPFLFFVSHSYPPIMKPVSTAESASSAMCQNNDVLLLHFVVAIETIEFCAQINIGRLHVKQFLT